MTYASRTINARVAATALAIFLLPHALRAQQPEAAARGSRPVQLPYVLRDNSGSALSVNVDGSLSDGQGDLFDAGGRLFIGNNFQYAPQNAQAQYNASRNELTLPPLPALGLNVSRRVRIDPRTGWCRFVEIFENPGATPVNTQVRLRFDVSGIVQGVEQVADDKRGGAVGLALFDGDDGIALLGGGRGAHPLTPVYSTQVDSDGVESLYEVVVPARKSVTIVHALAVRPALNDAVNLLRSVKDADVLAGLSPDVLRTLGNFAVADRLVGDLEILRGELFDVVELRGGDVYKGTLLDKAFKLQTPYATLDLPADRVVAMVTLGQFKPTQMLVTADGEVFGGALQGAIVRLELSSGHVTSIPMSSVRRFGYRRRAGEPDDARPSAAGALVVLRSGDRIAVEPLGTPLAVATCYGLLRIDPRAVSSVMFQSDQSDVHQVRLVDGSKFVGVVTQERFEVKLAGTAARAAGKSGAVAFPAAALKQIRLAADPDEPAPYAARLTLANGDVLAGALAGGLVLETAFDTIEVEAAGLTGLRQGTAADGDSSTGEVQLSLWDGTTLSGRVRGDAVDCALGCGVSVKVPVGLVQRYEQPRPRPSPQAVERMKAVVAELNAEDWKTRDRAAGQLASMGPASASVLRELRDGQPPEVRQRIDQILASFEPTPDPPGGKSPVRPEEANPPADLPVDPPERG